MAVLLGVNKALPFSSSSSSGTSNEVAGLTERNSGEEGDEPLWRLAGQLNLPISVLRDRVDVCLRSMQVK
jgi:hypothetical protein